MTGVANPVPPQNLSGIVGQRFIYTYANGWQYEMYVKNATTIDYRIHGVIFFPQRIRMHGERTVCFQNERLDQMRAYRDQGPTYPSYEVPEFACITLFEYVGTDDESVIGTAPGELPRGWSNRSKERVRVRCCNSYSRNERIRFS